MDAVKFLTESKRICQSYKSCVSCPLLGFCIDNIKDIKDAIKSVEKVEKWSNEHPVVTNGMKVWELIPENQRATAFKEAVPDFIGLGLITSEDYVQILVSKSWWDAEYKEGSNE